LKIAVFWDFAARLATGFSECQAQARTPSHGMGLVYWRWHLASVLLLLSNVAMLGASWDLGLGVGL
jgi:hypothetical protein